MGTEETANALIPRDARASGGAGFGNPKWARLESERSEGSFGRTVSFPVRVETTSVRKQREAGKFPSMSDDVTLSVELNEAQVDAILRALGKRAVLLTAVDPEDRVKAAQGERDVAVGRVSFLESVLESVKADIGAHNLGLATSRITETTGRDAKRA